MPPTATETISTDEERQDQARTEQVLVGMDDADALLAGRRGLYGVSASREIELAQERREKESSGDALFLLLLPGDGAGAFIGARVFGEMTDTQIIDIVQSIEAKTGMSFIDYARGVLGDDAVARLPGESDADYHRRVLQAVAAEVLDPQTGAVKPEYADDPVAQIITQHESYQRLLAGVRDMNSLLASGADPATLEARAREIAQECYKESDVLGHEIEDDGLAGTATGAQRKHKNDALKSDSAEERSAGLLDQFSGDPRPGDADKTGGEAEQQSPALPGPGSKQH